MPTTMKITNATEFRKAMGNIQKESPVKPNTSAGISSVQDFRREMDLINCQRQRNERLITENNRKVYAERVNQLGSWTDQDTVQDTIRWVEKAKETDSLGIGESEYDDILGKLNNVKQVYGSAGNAEEFALLQKYGQLTYDQWREKLAIFENGYGYASERKFDNKELNDEYQFLLNYANNVGFRTAEEYDAAAAYMRERLTQYKDEWERVHNTGVPYALAEGEKAPRHNMANISQEKIDEVNKWLSLYNEDIYEGMEATAIGYEKTAEYLRVESQYGGVRRNSDFQSKSQAVEAVNDDRYKKIGSLPGYETQEEFVPDNALTHEDYMTSHELDLYLYLYNTQGQAKANEYFEALKGAVLNDRMTGYISSSFSDAVENLWGIRDLYSIGTQLVDTLLLPVKVVGVITGDYKKNQAYFDIFATQTNAARAVTGEQLDNLCGTQDSGLASGTYQLLMGVADMVVTAKIGSIAGKAFSGAKGVTATAELLEKTNKISKTVTQILMSSSAASSTISEATSHGLSPVQVLALGAASFCAEWVTEKYSIEVLFSSPTSFGSYLRKMVVSEGFEEGASSILNAIADEIISGDNSKLKNRIYELMDSGYSYKDAVNKAFGEKVGEIGVDVLAGAVSGGMLASVGYAGHKLSTVNYATPAKYKNDLNAAKTWVLESLSGRDFAVKVKKLGTANLDMASIKDSVQKVETQEQALVFSALHKILKAGDVQLVKEKGVATVNAAAALNGGLHNVSVVLTDDGAGAFDVSFITLDGKALYDPAGLYEKIVNMSEGDSLEGEQAQSQSSAEQTAEAEMAGSQYSLVAPQLQNIDYDALERYDQRRYTNHGWVAVNRVLTGNEQTKLYAQWADAVENGYKYPKTPKGETIITVGDAYDSADTLVFISGTNQNPIISEVVKIVPQDPSDVSEIRQLLIDGEEQGDVYIRGTIEIIFGQGVLVSKQSGDFARYSELTGTRQNRQSDTSGNGDRQSGDTGARSGSADLNQDQGTVNDSTNDISLPSQDDGTGSFAVAQNSENAEQQKNATADGDVKDFVGEETTGIDIEDKSDYPYNMQTVIQDYIDSTDNHILEYAEKCRVDKNTPYERIPIAPVSDKQAADVERLLGIDFSGYQNTLEKSALNHIEKRHGINGEQDTSMKDLNDVARIGYILQNYDDVELTTDNDGNERYSKQFRDKNNRPVPMLRFSKKINGTYYAVIAFPDARYKKLWLVSAYISKKNSSSVTQESNAETLDSTPEAGLASPRTTTNNKVTQNQPVVNNNSMQKGSENSDPDVLESRSYDSPAEQWQAENKNEGSEAQAESIDAIVEDIEREFGIPISKGNIRQKNAAGIYKTQSEAIRTQIDNSLPVISHELGHHLAMKYKLYELPGVRETVNVMQKSNPKFASLYGPRQQMQEGIAEFVREYLRDRKEAKAKYPKFFKQFVKALGKDIDKVNAIADKVNAYMNSSPRDQIKLAITNRTNARKAKGTLKERIDKALEWTEDKMFDEVAGLKSVSNDAYKAYYNMLKSAVVNEVNLFEGMCDINGESVEGWETAGLAQVLAPINEEKSYDDFNAYLVCRRAVDVIAADKRVFANDRINDKKLLEGEIVRFESEHPEFKKVAENLYAWQKQFMKTWYVDTGMMTQNQLDDLWKKHPNYVPFNRNVSSKSGDAISSKIANQSPVLKKMHGSGLQLFDPVENIALRTAKIITSAKSNRVVQMLAQAVEDGSVPSVVLERISETKAEEFEKALKQNLKATATEEQTADPFEESINESVVDWSGSSLGGDVVWAMVNGERVYYQVHDARLLKSLTAMKTQQSETVLAAFACVSNLFKSLTTGNNVVWSLTSNSWRDFATGFMYGSEGNIFKYIRDYAVAAKDVFTNSERMKEARRGGLGYASKISKPKQLASLMHRLGQTQEGRAAVKGLFVRAIEGITSLSEAVEMAPRLAEYNRQRRRGESIVDSVYAASEITINFDRKGGVSKSIDALYPFFNAGMQGVYKLANTIKDPKLRKQFIIREVTSSLLTALFVLAANAVLGGKEEYEQLSDYVKNNYYCFHIGGGRFIRIPKARELAFLESVFERAGECVMYGNDFGDSFDGFTEYIFQTFSAPGVPDFLALAEGDFGDAVKPLVTDMTLLGSFAELGYNENYSGSAIVPSQYEELVPALQYDNKTSGLAKLIGSIFNVSPMQVDHIMTSNTGFVGKLIKAWTAEDADWTGGYGNQMVADVAYSNEASGRFYDGLDEAETYAKSYPDNGKYVSSYQQYNSVNSVLSYLYRQARGNPEKERDYRLLALAYSDEFLTAGVAQDDRLNAIYEEIGNKDVYPYITFSEKYTVNDEKNNSVEKTMTTDEFLKYAEIYNTAIGDIYDKILDGTEDKAVASKALVKAKGDIQDYARKAAVDPQTEKPGVMIAEEAGISAAQYYTIMVTVDTNNNSKIDQDEAEVTLDASGLNKDQKGIMWWLINPSWKYNPYQKRYY